MLVELSIRNLGVIESLDLVLAPGMSALTGETGAGKTMVVEAIELLLGGRADAVLVRPGADEARVDGRFVDGDREVVLSRVVPANGRTRAYVDGAMTPVSALAEAGAGLVDLHGQHAHQSLLSAAAQRGALDAFAGIDLSPLHSARSRLRAVDEALAALGGDERGRAREIDLLRFQAAELEAAGLSDPDEDDRLRDEEDRLADATAHREAAAAAHEALSGEGGMADALAVAVGALHNRSPLAELHDRLLAVAAEVSEAGHDLRAAAESLEDDPERLAAVRGRRRLLHDLRRKYGETMADVLAYFSEVSDRLAELEGHGQRAAALDAERVTAASAVAVAERVVQAARAKAAPKLAAAVEERLRELAMPRARFEVSVGEDGPGDEVVFLLSANAGEPALPLSKVASGGELARTMLAARLVLTGAPPTLVFDEVDAGIGGEAAVAVGRALAALASDGSQVLVVTHLPQVAAFADQQVAVWKDEEGGRTVARARQLDDGGRVVELSRMLSGQPESVTARGHAEELLAAASRERGR
ncbi:MAG TPA: DNA repair protein RecN [Acidimicrobiales bacterium]|nr:DNA repair protein RecN [Acidimicrobiales bacterium]